ncbi:MAG TPA: proline--tRNA ligase [Chloroflexota bacterium]|nr:proline--tRNA ligase [Chloroflexota bacterium]
MTQLMNQTLREAPAGAEVEGHRLLLRAGFVRQQAAGIFSYLHLGHRTLQKLEAIMRQEIDALGGQEMLMPLVHPAAVWQESKRWYEIDDEMGRFQDKNGRDMVLALSHEEIVTDLARREIQSYRQLPRLVYHIQLKWRDDPRPRAGLIRAREFTMLDSYTLDADDAGLDKQYWAHYEAYFRIYGRCGIPVIAVESDVGMMGGTLAHEFMYLTPIGEDTLLLCESCGYKANRQIAAFRKTAVPAETPLPLEKVATPDAKTIEALAQFLSVPKSKTAKAVFMTATIKQGQTKSEKLIFAVVRGDMELNETKLTNAVKAQVLRPSTEDEIRAVGAVPGYASPIGLSGITVVVDDAAAAAPNLVAGANEAGYHLKNVNHGRDYNADIITDIAAAAAGDACPQCGEAMTAVRGVEVGNIFKLGTRYTETMGATYLDENGASHPIIMGSYGVGVTRLLACLAEHCHDEQGLVWPVTVAPYPVHLVSLRGGEETAVTLYHQLQQASIEVLYDDRDESPGVKFNDADLIGLPIRLTVSGRSLQNGGVECKLRHATDRSIIPLADVIPQVQSLIVELAQTITNREFN